MTTIVQAAYIVAALLFIMALAGLAKHETAKTGNAYGVAGMTIAIIATMILTLQSPPIGVAATIGLIVLAMAIGAAIGLWRAKSVEMTQMPELIAILHSLVGAAAVLVGYYVIFNVTHALHTPLMSETNAISGIILVGALSQIGHGGAVTVVSFIALAIASINVFGGFTVTQRMLTMFRKG